MLARNEEAQQLHDQGLSALCNGHIEGAIEDYGNALAVLQDTDTQSVPIQVQTARIMRDKGFTHARAAMLHLLPPAREDEALAELGTAQQTLAASSALTHLALQRAPEEYAAAMSEIHAEHGATLSCLGRVATLNSVVTTGTDEFVSLGSRQYKEAHQELKQGNNGYYRVSNAMTAARHERLNGTPQGALLWLGRAATGLGWTAVHDRTNFAPAAKTLANRVRHLHPFNRRAAKSSVEVKP